MIFKIMPASVSFHGVEYNEKKKEQGVGSLIYFENFGYLQERSQVSKHDVKDFFRKHSASNKRVKKPQFHAILSCRGQERTHEELKQNALRIIEGLGYKDQPLLIYQHSDTKNNHVHIVTSRVDSNGKKINDKFEGMRANVILNEILSIDKKQVHKKSLDEVFSYKVSTASQFVLLLEKQGYVCKRRGEELLLFKYGHKQGSLTSEQIQKQLEISKDLKANTKELEAMIEKYKQQYPPGLISQPISNTPIGKRKYSSHLTEYLHKNHGMEFVFFSAKNHDKPYGYVIIDHNNKAVIKGSEVMKLDHLISSLPISKESQKDQGRDAGQGLETASHTANTKKQRESLSISTVHRPNQSFINEELLQSLDMVIDDALKENESSGVAFKRKKARKRNQ